MKFALVASLLIASAAAYPGYSNYGHGLPQQVGDTHEVALAKAQHFAAVEEAKIRNAAAEHSSSYGGYSGGATSHVHIDKHEGPAIPLTSGGYGGHSQNYHGSSSSYGGHGATSHVHIEKHEGSSIPLSVSGAAHYGGLSYQGSSGSYGGHGATSHVSIEKHEGVAIPIHVSGSGSYGGHNSYVSAGGYGGSASGIYGGHGLAPGQDTHEVAVAKAKHFAAHAEAKSRLALEASRHIDSHGYGGHYDSGYEHGEYLAPGQDTAAVAIAKAQHFQAHAQAKAHLSHY